MSHLILRMGDLLHFHPFAHGLSHRKEVSREEHPPEIVKTDAAGSSDELAFFSLSVEGAPVDGRKELEHFGLVRPTESDTPEDFEPWPLRLM